MTDVRGPVLSRAEMDRRHLALREKMRAQELDGVIATSYAAFYYLSGAPIHPFGRPMAILVPVDGEPAIVESVIERDHSSLQSWIRDIRCYWDYNPTPTYENPRPPIDSLVYYLQIVVAERGLASKRVGIEEATLPLSHYRALQRAFPKAELVGVSELLDRLRLVKSVEELALIRAADSIADRGLEVALESIRPCQAANELHSRVVEAMTTYAFEHYADMPFDISPNLGLGSPAKEAGHSHWVTWGPADQVKPGQIIEAIFPVWVWGYSGNVERAVSVGEPRGRQRELFEIMVEMNEAAIAAIRPGLPVAEIDRLCKAHLARHNLTTFTGSGVGKGITSWEGNARELMLDLRPYSDVVLQPGMAFSLEPDVREDGTGVFRHCNTIIVTEDGCEVDSKVPRGVIWV